MDYRAVRTSVLALVVMGCLAESAAQSAGGPPRLSGVTFPLTYVQSGFFTDDPPVSYYASQQQKRLRTECLARFFDGAEVIDLNIDTAAGRHDVRDLSTAIGKVSAENRRPFYGFWSFPRLPGFFRKRDIDQSADWRACSLRADGSLWVRYPSPPDDIESEIKFTGEVLDITNHAAVTKLLGNLARVFRWDGPPDECVGPLRGFIELNEWILSSNYESVWSRFPGEHDVASPNTVMSLKHETHDQLFHDDDPYYSYFNPPKRAVPLFTVAARDSFAAYAHARGKSYTHLPADRNEFNDDDATVSLPPWVQFVPLSDKVYWQTWSDWVYETWTKFVESVCRTWVLAQRGNPDFHGVLYFQLPMWYSLPVSSQTPISYQYVDASGTTHTATETMADYAEYDRLNPVAMGTNMDYLMHSPWLAGMIDETTHSIPVYPKGKLKDWQYDLEVESSDRFRHYFMAQGALAKRLCRETGKIFGAFARSQPFRGDSRLSPPEYSAAFSRTIDILKPDIVATSFVSWFIDPKRVAPQYRQVMQDATGALQDVWLELSAKYREPPPIVWAVLGLS